MSAADFIPERPTLPKLRKAAADCRGCHLWEGPIQTVFGEGPADARLMLVGEVPGDREDREGHPFVGPAGRELDRGLEAAGIERAEALVTLDSELAPIVAATIHPSAILRSRDEEARRTERQAFAADLRLVVEALS